LNLPKQPDEKPDGNRCRQAHRQARQKGCFPVGKECYHVRVPEGLRFKATLYGVTKQAMGLPKKAAASKRGRCTGSLVLRKALLGPVLNPFASLFHILTKAVGGLAADADDDQECGGKE
jgi:hypothetical protein